MTLFLKIVSILFAGLPLMFACFFILQGGPDPGSGDIGIFGLISILFFTGVCFFILPNRIILRWHFGPKAYAAFCIFVFLICLVVAKFNVYSLPTLSILSVITGISCGALSMYIETL